MQITLRKGLSDMPKKQKRGSEKWSCFDFVFSRLFFVMRIIKIYKE